LATNILKSWAKRSLKSQFYPQLPV